MLRARHVRFAFLVGLLTAVLTGSTLTPALIRRLDRAPRPAANGSRASAFASGPSSPAPSTSDHDRVRVTKVVDGDTFLIPGDEAVRILGIDTPEKEEPFYREATTFLRSRIAGRPVTLIRCAAEPRDAYGRLLAFVEVDGRDPGLALLREGLARTLILGPCAARRARDYRQAERAAFRTGKGIWSRQALREVPHTEAHRHVGKRMSVLGKVLGVHTGRKAIHLNFGPDYRTDFTAVIFRKDLPRLVGEGLPKPDTLQGKTVTVTGRLERYNGPEIIVRHADQIMVQGSP